MDTIKSNIAALAQDKKTVQGKQTQLPNAIQFLLDSGSNYLVVTNGECCTNVQPANITIKVGGGTITCRKVGTAWLNLPLPDGTTRQVKFDNVRIIHTF